MKTTVLLLLCMLTCYYSANAQSLAMATNYRKTQPTTADENIPAENHRFILQNYGIDLTHEDLTEYPEHFLGDNVARKKYATQKIYVRRHPSTIGFSDNTVEIAKPDIYNALGKIEHYFKKAVKRNEITTTKASEDLAKCFDIAYLAYYEDETENLEHALRKAKTPEELLNIFNSTLIKE